MCRELAQVIGKHLREEVTWSSFCNAIVYVLSLIMYSSERQSDIELKKVSFG